MGFLFFLSNMDGLNTFKLSKDFFDWSFENPEKIKPIHSAIYFFAIDKCNRLGWKEKFGFPSSHAMEALGIRSYNTYKKALDELVEFGFINMIETSKNQHTANIIALSNFDKALSKALAKATAKQDESTVQSNCSIDILKTKELKNEEEKVSPLVSANREKAKANKKAYEARVNFKDAEDPIASLETFINQNLIESLCKLPTFMKMNQQNKEAFTKDFSTRNSLTKDWNDKADLLSHLINSMKLFKADATDWKQIHSNMNPY